ncbi:hypothetical protein D9611_006203 [Ephemerocybe angulata]|uniref:RING-type E3 ubiquitin transferase n=1 Tax=Ephemerocybe angulata TaxID=980116 RepID=A0A8H5C6I4_9AGAR|nr:hypothetical protein D9611_006203 [Tulosesus angulatus]
MSTTVSASALTPPNTGSARPQTHKPRGVCRYYKEPRGCFAGDHCKFLHGDPVSNPPSASETSSAASERPAPVLLTPYDQAKICRYYVNGFCKRGEGCWFRHVLDPKKAGGTDGKREAEEVDDGSESDSEAPPCSICFEAPSTYGLLSGCNHVFCLSCIKQWRDSTKGPSMDVENSTKKKCPMCRTSSNFIIPSSIFVKHDTKEKEGIVEKYKGSMAKVQCRYFQKTLKTRKPMCPFGKDCFYKHENADGSLHVFTEGASVWINRYYGAHGRSGRNGNNIFVFSDTEADRSRLFGIPGLDLRTMRLVDLLETVNRVTAPRNPARPRNDRPAATPGAGAGPVDLGAFNVSLRPFSLLQMADEETAAAHRGNPQGNPPNFPPLPEFLASHRRTHQTVQGIEQSLDDLTSAMDAGASLDRISETVQNLQQNLRRNGPGGNGDSIERLTSLTDQMLASVDLLRGAGAVNTTPRNQAPGGAPATRNPGDAIFHRFPRRHVALQTNLSQPSTDIFARDSALSPEISGPATNRAYSSDDDDDDDDMPALQSISNSSDEDMSDLYDSDSDSESDVNGDILEAIAQGLLNGLSDEYGRSRRDGGAGPGPQSNDELDDSDDEGPPPLIPIDSLEPETSWHDGIDQLAPPVSSPPPPFVTDGRGRVVWTSSESSSSGDGTSVRPSANPVPAPSYVPPAVAHLDFLATTDASTTPTPRPSSPSPPSSPSLASTPPADSRKPADAGSIQSERSATTEDEQGVSAASDVSTT